METTIIPNSFESWHHCITVECKIKLTEDYIKNRIKTLENQNDFRTKQFISLYGNGHRVNVIGWFKEALNSV